MHAFVRNLVTEWRRLELPVEGGTVAIGVSGGADSVSLLLAMYELQQSQKLHLRLIAAHFNHRLRDGESDRDEEFVRELTAKRRIEFAVGHARPLDGGNLEQNARVARYEFLNRIANGVQAFAILTGHTLNDQAETFLMNLIRGSGRTGLCGMKAVRTIEEEVPNKADGCEPTENGDQDPTPLLFPTSRLLVRPLLRWAKREHTEQYCRDNQIDYRYDTMNEDTALRRVRIRKILLPMLKDMNPNIVETLANTAFLMQDLPGDDRLGDRAPVADELILSELRSLPKTEISGAIRAWLAKHRGNTRRLQLKHIQAIERLVFSQKSGREVELPGGCVTKTGGKLRYKEN